MSRPRRSAQESSLFEKHDMFALNALCSDPLGTSQRLATAAGMSVQTFRKRIAVLSKSQILLRVGARISPSPVGLQNVGVFANIPFNKLEYVEKACDLHPYTTYRVRCLGSTNGLYILFAIPIGIEFQLTEFLDALVTLRLMENYSLVTTTAESIHSNPDFSLYEFDNDEWKFDMKKWARELSNHKKDLQPPVTSMLSKLDLRDLRLMRELTIDARRDQKLIGKQLHFPEYHISRRLKFMSENGVISSYEVFLGRRLFRFAPGALFDVRCELDGTRAVASGVGKLPFQTSMLPTREGFILFTGLPTTFFTEMGSALLRYCRDVKMMWTDYDNSMRYYFDETPYVEQTGQWNTDRKFTIEVPLANLKSHIEKGSGTQP